MSTLRANTIADAAGTGPATLTGQVASKAIYTFDQVVNAIDSSFNISSVTDRGTGSQYGNYTNSMADILGQVIGCASTVAAGSMATTSNGVAVLASPDTTARSSSNVFNTATGARFDGDYSAHATYGDLA